MTAAEFHNYLLCVSILATIIGLINLARPNRRWLGAGAILIGIGGVLYAQGLPVVVVAIVCGLGVFALGKDIASRARRPA